MVAQLSLFAEANPEPEGPPVGTLDGDLDALAEAVSRVSVWCGPQGWRRCLSLRPSAGVMQQHGQLRAVLVADLGEVADGRP